MICGDWGGTEVECDIAAEVTWGGVGCDMVAEVCGVVWGEK